MHSITVEHLSKCYRIGKGSGDGSGLPGVARVRSWLGFKQAPKRPQREIWAVKDVSFALEPGTVLGIIGPNGAGKTTLLKILARVTQPTEGRVVGRGRVASLLELGFGFQPDLTGRQNVLMTTAMHGIARPAVKLDKIVEFAEIGEFIDLPISRYSSGMYLRLAFSVAVNMEPDILLADEVLAVGDIAFQERCLQRVQEAGEAGMTVLFVSHDMAAIIRLCHQVIWLNAGRIVKYGEPRETVAEYQNSAWILASQGRKKGLHANKYVEVHSIRLVSSTGSEIGAVRVAEDVFVSIRFLILRANVGVRCAFHVSTAGVYVFRSVLPEEFHADRKGTYIAHARIPAHLLAETIYTLKASVNIVSGGEEHPVTIDKALTFQVYNPDELQSARGTYKGTVPGVVMPRLEWKIAREPDAGGE